MYRCRHCTDSKKGRVVFYPHGEQVLVKVRSKQNAQYEAMIREVLATISKGAVIIGLRSGNGHAESFLSSIRVIPFGGYCLKKSGAEVLERRFVEGLKI